MSDCPLEIAGRCRPELVDSKPGQGKSKAAKIRHKLAQLKFQRDVPKVQTPLQAHFVAGDRKATLGLHQPHVSCVHPLNDDLGQRLVRVAWFPVSLVLVLLGARWGSEMSAVRQIDALHAELQHLKAQESVSHCLPWKGQEGQEIFTGPLHEHVTRSGLDQRTELDGWEMVTAQDMQDAAGEMCLAKAARPANDAAAFSNETAGDLVVYNIFSRQLAEDARSVVRTARIVSVRAHEMGESSIESDTGDRDADTSDNQRVLAHKTSAARASGLMDLSNASMVLTQRKQAADFHDRQGVANNVVPHPELPGAELAAMQDVQQVANESCLAFQEDSKLVCNRDVVKPSIKETFDELVPSSCLKHESTAYYEWSCRGSHHMRCLVNFSNGHADSRHHRDGGNLIAFGDQATSMMIQAQTLSRNSYHRLEKFNGQEHITIAFGRELSNAWQRDHMQAELSDVQCPMRNDSRMGPSEGQPLGETNMQEISASRSVREPTSVALDSSCRSNMSQSLYDDRARRSQFGVDWREDVASVAPQNARGYYFSDGMRGCDGASSVEPSCGGAHCEEKLTIPENLDTSLHSAFVLNHPWQPLHDPFAIPDARKNWAKIWNPSASFEPMQPLVELQAAGTHASNLGLKAGWEFTPKPMPDVLVNFPKPTNWQLQWTTDGRFPAAWMAGPHEQSDEHIKQVLDLSGIANHMGWRSKERILGQSRDSGCNVECDGSSTRTNRTRSPATLEPRRLRPMDGAALSWQSPWMPISDATQVKLGRTDANGCARQSTSPSCRECNFMRRCDCAGTAASVNCRKSSMTEPSQLLSSRLASQSAAIPVEAEIGNPVKATWRLSWASFLRKVVSDASAEANYLARSTCGKYAQYFQDVVRDATNGLNTKQDNLWRLPWSGSSVHHLSSAQHLNDMPLFGEHTHLFGNEHFFRPTASWQLVWTHSMM